MKTLNSISRRDFIKSSIVAGAAAAGMRSVPLNGASAANDPATPLRFGANYTPRKRWWYCWQDWDQASIVDDLSAVGELGMDHIRIQCLWPIFQPGINQVSDSVLHNLYLLLEAAGRAGLDVEVTVLNGDERAGVHARLGGATGAFLAWQRRREYIHGPEGDRGGEVAVAQNYRDRGQASALSGLRPRE
ncbi:MAG TPA: twin-arginine translocation signal domain-containing protein [Terriglobia bacterium]|nr:twin-arginine translocation signal domain-containing protein [Terriglobia bacterium]